MIIAAYTNDDDDDQVMIASYIYDAVDKDRIVHTFTIYNAANFLNDIRTNGQDDSRRRILECFFPPGCCLGLMSLLERAILSQISTCLHCEIHFVSKS